MPYNRSSVEQQNFTNNADNRKRIVQLVAVEGTQPCEEDAPNVVELIKVHEERKELVKLMLDIVPMKTTAKKRRLSDGLDEFVDIVVPDYTDDEFLQHFRIKRKQFHNLVALFEESETYRMLREDKRMSAAKHLLMFLWFAGNASCDFRDLSQRFKASISSVSRAIKRVTYFLADLSEFVIKWHTKEEMTRAADYFQSMNGFPSVIGAVAAIHIPVEVTKQDKVTYSNGNGQTSIILQAICNERRKFVDISVGSPGPTHKSRVFTESEIYAKLPELCQNFILLADAAYPLGNNVLTPYRHNGYLTPAQILYNRKLNECRTFIDYALTTLKQRFRQLDHVKLRGLEKVSQFVRACCVLNNLCKEDDFSINLLDSSEVTSGETVDQQSCEDAVPDSSTGSIFRERMCDYIYTT
ncbi:uncharacterized protein LOC131685260 [Topomyia yanbarensis]|uniref:uncharacterized protein LOC131685260 n=1 Tax=Topomyia yanbarensis TaxID=2498891 RepID=UPI00273AE7A2|nr:uncharacterized protein LOC131685260 [Topomyia yanbarensis]XP_058824842.1 uncharacterized protein LOC131685260 [Topomyia yanbarensis]XP_058824843.1 uncharacterized protein LOC131685260 [Topomyia yanbarensis]XP_058824845.1 uncharacterized protein LOC131685260 [Topomyia yanbarensis]